MYFRVLAAAVLLFPTSSSLGAETVLVEEGKPRAEIVVAEQRPRMVTLAALELRHFVEKASGARLPIVTTPSEEKRVRIFIGRSVETDRLGITAEGLQDGGYRIVVEADRLVLIGNDRDFDTSNLPWPLKRDDVARAADEWAKSTAGQTDTAWNFPFRSGFKGFWNPKDFPERMNSQYGDDFSKLWIKEPGLPAGFWNEDEGGSLNAVYGLLRHLGMRWYMPGEIGEVVPKSTTIKVRRLDETVKPDFALRDWNWYNYSGFSFDDIIWARRLGMNTASARLGPLTGPHGLVPVHGSAAMKKAHPEYYALINGSRDTDHRDHGTPCFTSEGLEQETINYIRFLFDKYDLPSADIWPVDGLRLCQCEGCAGKSASDLVWGFADRVACKVYETHPTRRITCGAYTSYVDPPETIGKLSPNLMVWISNCARPKMEDPEHWADYRQRIEKWQRKVAPGNILRLENNRYHIWGDGEPITYPVLHPRGVARDLKFLKGISLGDSGEQSQVGGKWRSPGLEHITLYVQSRFLWDAEQDVDQVLDEYCQLFYGPAAQQMKEAITFAEQNLAHKDQSRRGKGNPMNVSLAVNLRLREMLEAAQQTAGETIYRQRIQGILAELLPKEAVIAKYRDKDAALAAARAKTPTAVGIEGSELSQAIVYTLKENRKGAAAPVKTTFRVAWDKDAILFDIHCQEPEIEKLSIHQDVHNGDNVVISLETPLHSYYHLEINPEGVVTEGNPGPNWKSLAEVKTERGNDFWRVKVRLPVVGEADATSDPRHRVAGRKPTAKEPWYFNVGRQRVLDLKIPELQAFSPTQSGWHVPEKFGKLIMD